MNRKKFIGALAGALIAVLMLTGCNDNQNVTFVDIESAQAEITENSTDNVVEDNNADISSDHSGEENAEDTENDVKTECELEDGVYLADFDTDGSMFHVNEAKEGKGTLTVKDGKMTIHVTLPSKNTVNLFYGLAEDAQKEGAVLIEPTIDEVTYSDGTTEEVHGFDIPVPYLNDEFDCALIGTKGKWYDHKVSVSNPVLADGTPDVTGEVTEAFEAAGETVNVTLEGGTGKATIDSPALVKEIDGQKYLVVAWTSPNYDYMIVNGEKYLPVNTEGNSVFEIPVDSFDKPLDVIADTVAMSKPHEIEYTIHFE